MSALTAVALVMSTNVPWEWHVHQALTIIDSGVRWRLEVVEGIGWDHAFLREFEVHLRRNGKKVATYGNIERGSRPIQEVLGASFGVSIPKVRAPFKVAAIRGHSGAGHGQQTLFLGFSNGAVFQMGFGSEAGEVGGPVNFNRRSDSWLFDDYTWYGHYDLTKSTVPLHRLLYRIGKDGKLRFVRQWLAPVRKQLPDTVGMTYPN